MTETMGEFMRRVVAVKTKEEATAFIAAEVERWKSEFGKTAEESFEIIMGNIGYCAGYYDRETMATILELFNTSHPVFGKRVDMSPEEAFAAGRKMALDVKP